MRGFPDSAGASPWKPNARTPSPKNSPTSPPAVANYGGIFDYDEKASKLEEVNRALEDPAVWNNAERAQELGKEKRQLEDVVLTLQKIDAQSRDLKDLFELAEAEDDDDTFEAVPPYPSVSVHGRQCCPDPARRRSGWRPPDPLPRQCWAFPLHI